MSTLKVDTIASDTTPTITISDGLNVTGVTTSTGNINISNDSGRLRIGAGADLEIYHDGSNSYIQDSGTGELRLRGTNIRFSDNDGSETFGLFTDNGSCDLYYDNSKKFETTSWGADITGKLRADTLQLAGDNQKLQIGASDDLEIYHDGSTNIIDSASANLEIRHGSEKMIACAQDGQVELWYDNVKTVETVPNGLRVNGGEGEYAYFYMYSDEGDDNADRWRTEVGNGGAHILSNYAGGGWEKNIVCSGNGGVELWHDNNKKFNTSSAGGTLTGDWFLTTGGYLSYPDGVQSIYGTGDDMRVHHTGGVNHVRASNGNLVLGTQTNHMVILGAYYNAGGGGDTCEVWGGANFLPATNDAIDLGETNHKWDDIYATNGTIQTSDQNNKDNIATSDLGLSFIDKLSPKSYKFKGKTRTHYGLIAQDVETVLSDISKATSDFAGFIKTDAPVQLYNERDEAHNRIPSGKAIGDVKLAAHTDYGLRYGEFIGPLIKAVQELSAKVTALESA